jgi:hemoglobin/transferrin/lactoferrin receptor protein
VLFIGLRSNAQVVSVRDKKTNNPIAGASLTSNSSIRAFTDVNGNVDISAFSGTDTITVRSLGHQSIQTTPAAIKQMGSVVYLLESNLSLDAVIVSANRWEQNLREIPNAVSTIEQSAIQFQNPQTAADLLTISNKVFVQKSQLGGGSPMLRGFATNRVLLVVDGVRMNNAIFRSGNVQNVISLDANSIEETEVIFGPGSVMYGSDAIGGVMDFHTLSPKLSTAQSTNLAINALTRYSTANKEKTAHVDFNIGLKKWAFATSLTVADYDNLTMGTKGPIEYTRPNFVVRENSSDVIVPNPDRNEQVSTAYNQVNALQKIYFAPTAHWSFTYAFHYSKSSNIPRYDRLILSDSLGNLTQGEWYYGPQKWMMNNMQVENNSVTALSDHIKIRLAQQLSEESRHSRSFGSSTRTNRFEEVDATSINIDIDKQLPGKASVFYGAEYIFNKVGSTANRVNITNGEIQNASTRYPDGATWQSIAAYVSIKKKLTEKWILNLSGRFTHVQSSATFDTAFFDLPVTITHIANRAVNGSVGLVYNPTLNWKLYANLSTGFRAPNIDDIGKVFDSEPGNVVVPNPGLEAEIAYNAETGFATVINERVKIDGALFYSLIDNAIARGSFTLNGQDSIEYDGILSQVQAQQNISKVYVYGVQMGIDIQLAEGLNLGSTINFQKGKERDPETNRNFAPTHVAPLFGNISITFRKKKLTASVYANYNGEINYKNLALSERADKHLYAKDKNGNPYAPSWFVLNAKASYTFIDKITVDLGIENILDKRYRPYSSGITAPGRNFIVSLRAKI